MLALFSYGALCSSFPLPVCWSSFPTNLVQCVICFLSTWLSFPVRGSLGQLFLWSFYSVKSFGTVYFLTFMACLGHSPVGKWPKHLQEGTCKCLQCCTAVSVCLSYRMHWVQGSTNVQPVMVLNIVDSATHAAFWFGSLNLDKWIFCPHWRLSAWYVQ